MAGNRWSSTLGCCSLPADPSVPWKEGELGTLLFTLPRRTSCVMERPILEPMDTPGEELISEPEVKVPLLSPRGDSVWRGESGLPVAYPYPAASGPDTPPPLMALLGIPNCALRRWGARYEVAQSAAGCGGKGGGRRRLHGARGMLRHEAPRRPSPRRATLGIGMKYELMGSIPVLWVHSYISTVLSTQHRDRLLTGLGSPVGSLS